MSDVEKRADGPLFPERTPLPGPEIPNAEVDEKGVFRFPKGDGEVYESVRLEYPIAPLLEEETAIEWLWPERIALGMVTVLEGANSAGKSFVALDMAARVTCGASWPGRVEAPERAGDVLLVCGDADGWERVILPRLTEAGANLSRVARCNTVESHDPSVSHRKRAYTLRRLSFPHDLGMLEYMIRIRPETRLVVIDPLSAFCDGDRAFRETLRQLDEIAARRNVAIVVTARPAGAAGAAARRRPHECDRRADTARAVFRVLVDFEDETLHHLAPVRMSFCALPAWLPFQIVAALAGRGVVAWGAPAEAPPESAIPPNPATERGALRRTVVEWLRAMLLKSDMPITTVQKEAKTCGFSEATLRRAREQLGVRMFRDEGGPLGMGWWTLRPKDFSADAPDDAVNLSVIQSWEPRPVERLVSPRGEQKKHRKAGKRGAGKRRAGKAGATTPQAGEPELQGVDSEQGADPLSDAAWDEFREKILAAVVGRGIESGLESEDAERVPPCNGHSAANGKHESNGRHDSHGDRPKPR